MDVYDEGGTLIEEWDSAKGRLEYHDRSVVHRYVVESPEEGHLETVAEYPETGGKDVAWVVDEPEVGAWHTYDAETDEEIEGYRGPVAEDWPHEDEVRDIYQYAVYIPYTEEELAAMGEAEAAAALAATRSAQVATFAALAMPALAPTINDSRAAEVSSLVPAYVPEGHVYKAGEVFRTEDGSLWRVSQDFTSQAQWAPGGEGLDALFYRIEVAPGGVIVWAQPHGAYDAVAKGDLRHYPDADGPVYRSLVEGNAYSPEAYPASWELVE